MCKGTANRLIEEAKKWKEGKEKLPHEKDGTIGLAENQQSEPENEQQNGVAPLGNNDHENVADADTLSKK